MVYTAWCVDERRLTRPTRGRWNKKPGNIVKSGTMDMDVQYCAEVSGTGFFLAEIDSFVPVKCSCRLYGNSIW